VINIRLILKNLIISAFNGTGKFFAKVFPTSASFPYSLKLIRIVAEQWKSHAWRAGSYH
jgi:uncharacterized ion transporter superfamily protein YfcC